jgi:hypothetical protein
MDNEYGWRITLRLAQNRIDLVDHRLIESIPLLRTVKAEEQHPVLSVDGRHSHS